MFSIPVFIQEYSSSNIGFLFSGYFYIFTGVSLALSVSLFFAKKTISVYILLSVRFFVIFLTGYPLGIGNSVEIIMMSSLFIETSIYAGSHGSIILQAIYLTLFIIPVSGDSAWWIEIPENNSGGVLFPVFILAVSAGLSRILKYQQEKISFLNHKIKHLDSAISQLSSANMGFQSYVKTLEIQVVMSERKRVSREIHDTVGYALTNIIMMMEAAIRLPCSEYEKISELLSLTRSQAQKGLKETRAALRLLRNERVMKLEGTRMIEELVSAFKKATGIEISMEYGNFKGFTNDRIDAIIFRIIQEGLTNAFRHGMATKIRISFWESPEYLQIIIHDNGVGAEKVVEGIGIAGMKERIQEIGGELYIRSVEDGFKVTAKIPHEE